MTKEDDMTGVRRGPWRDAATILLAVVVAVAIVSVVLDGGRPAFAADDCQYGQYAPYGQPCPKATPTLRLFAPVAAGIGTGAFPLAILENGTSPTGLLVVRLHRPGEGCANPAQPPAWIGQANASGNGAYPFGGFLFFDRVGTWTWSATYAGDTRNEAISTVCGAFTTLVGKRTPFLSLSIPPSLVAGGSATVFGSASLFQPTAPLTLRVYGPADPECTGTPTFTHQATTMPSFTEIVGPLGEGTWRFVLRYPGDANNEAAATACDANRVTVTRVQASLSLSVSPQPAMVGQAVSAHVSVLGHEPTGLLTLRLFEPSDVACSTPVRTESFAVQGGGPYTTRFTPTHAGTWLLTSSYSGDTANIGVSQPCGSVGIPIAKAEPELTLTADPTSARSRDTLLARLELHGGYQPAGRVEFRLFDPVAQNCTGAPSYVEVAQVVNGVARTASGFRVPKQAPGTWNWTASYEGDANNQAKATGCGETSVTVVDPGAAPQQGHVGRSGVAVSAGVGLR